MKYHKQSRYCVFTWMDALPPPHRYPVHCHALAKLRRRGCVPQNVNARTVRPNTRIIEDVWQDFAESEESEVFEFWGDLTNGLEAARAILDLQDRDAPLSLKRESWEWLMGEEFNWESVGTSTLGALTNEGVISQDWYDTLFSIRGHVKRKEWQDEMAQALRGDLPSLDLFLSGEYGPDLKNVAETIYLVKDMWK